MAGAEVTAGFFDVWRVAPVLGRGLEPADFVAGDRWCIGHRVWQNHFGQRPDVVGATARIDGRPYTVVGVMPATFRLPGDVQVWVPWVMSAEERRSDGSTSSARSRASLTHHGRAQAERELDAIYAGLRRCARRGRRLARRWFGRSATSWSATCRGRSF